MSKILTMSFYSADDASFFYADASGNIPKFNDVGTSLCDVKPENQRFG